MATNASTIAPLERAFARFAEGLGVDEVRYIGGAGGGEWSLAASEESLQDYGALECREVDHGARIEIRNDPLDAALGV
jgi:hypothetical protein